MNRRQTLRLLGAATAALVVRPGRLWAESSDDMAARARDVLATGDTAGALEILARAQARDARNDHVQALLGRAYFQQGDARRALEHFQMAVRLNPEDTLSRMMAETIRQFPLPGRSTGGGGRSQGRSASTLAEEARAERQLLSQQGGAPRQPGPFRLLLDPGHGGSDPGAPGDGPRESDVALDLALRLARILGASRDTVAFSLTRTADVFLPGWARAALAAFYGADLLFSLHATRVNDPAATGLVFYSLGRTAGDTLASAVASVENTDFGRSADFWGRGGQEVFVAAARRAAGEESARRGAALAGVLAKAVPASSPLAPRLPGAAPLRLLAETQTPAVLVETGFLSHPGDREVLAAADRRQGLAQSLATAVLAVAAATVRPGQEGQGTSAPAREGR